MADPFATFSQGLVFEYHLFFFFPRFGCRPSFVTPRTNFCQRRYFSFFFSYSAGSFFLLHPRTAFGCELFLHSVSSHSVCGMGPGAFSFLDKIFSWKLPSDRDGFIPPLLLIQRKWRFLFPSFMQNFFLLMCCLELTDDQNCLIFTILASVRSTPFLFMIPSYPPPQQIPSRVLRPLMKGVFPRMAYFAAFSSFMILFFF